MGLRATDGTRGMWGDRPPGPLGAAGRRWAQLTKESPLQPRSAPPRGCGHLSPSPAEDGRAPSQP